jgi:phosphonate transport system substrate-binding protein
MRSILHFQGMALALAALAGLLQQPACAGEPPKVLRQANLRVLYSSSLYSSINRNDALAAMKTWVQTIGRNRGFLLDTTVDSFDRLEEADKRIQEDAVDLVSFNAVEFLRTTQAGKLDAEFIAGCQNDRAPNDFVVVARRDCHLAALADLRGKSVKFYSLGADWGRLWMDVALGDAGLGAADGFFGSNSQSDKPSSVVLPVFFGQCDAGVVKRGSFDTMAELNPQLSTQLQILAHSPALPDLVVCVNKNYKGFRDDLLQGLADLQDEPSGQQILLLFRTDKLTRFKSGQLDAAREILARHAKAARSDVIAVSAEKPELRQR